MKKRIASLIMGGALAAAAVIGFTGCGGSDKEDGKGGGSKKLTLWGPSAQQVSLQEMVNQFLKENPDFGLKIELGVAGEGDAYGMMSNDVKSGADVFAYANDQLANLYSIGAVAKLTDSTVDSLKKANVEASVEAGKIADGYYGYPYAADNGFFMYYDKSVVSEEQATSLEAVLDACKAKRKYLIYQFGTGWYAGSFIYGVGGSYSVKYDGSTVSEINCDFDQKPEGSQYSYGELGGQQLIDFKKHPGSQDGDDAVIASYLKGGKVGACITGTWNAGVIQEYLKENYAATVLPKWTSSLDGKTYDWKSFAGYKLYGVNSFSKHLPEAHKLAAYLSSQAMQEKRFDDSAIGPSNKTVAAMQKVQDNVAIAAINAQIATNSVIQTSMPQSYWTEMESFAKAMMELAGDAENPNPTVSLERVQELVKALKAINSKA